MAKVYTLSPKSSTDSSTAIIPVMTENATVNQITATNSTTNLNSVQDHRVVTTYDHRYKKIALQHSSGNESASSTDFVSSSSTTSQSAQRQTSNSSTASLEALSRRGSNPEASGSDLGINHMGTTTATGVCTSPICVRSCTVWAEILVRRPTGNISWITRIQNPISGECLGYDIPFSNIASLFLPTSYGGLYGPDFPPTERSIDYQEPISLEEPIIPNDEQQSNVDTKTDFFNSNKSLKVLSIKNTVCKNRPLQRQEEITSTTAVNTTGSAAIDIPKSIATKRGKEALSGSVSDGEADENSMTFEGDENRTRKPVRRVNSSPEMSSSWRNNFLNNKRPSLRRDVVPREQIDESEILRDSNLLQQKKKCIQYSKVSCEAIPEEIAGSTPPQHLTNSKVDIESNTVIDDIASANAINNDEDNDAILQQNNSDIVNVKNAFNLNVGVSQANLVRTNERNEKINGNSNKTSQNLPSFQNVTRSTSNVTVAVPKSPSFGSHQSLAKSSSGSNAVNLGVDHEDYNNGVGEMMRGRSKTISVVREVNNGKTRATNNFRSFNTNKPQINTKLCMHPSFIFMQLYHTGPQHIGDVPIKVPVEQMGAVNLLDLAPPFETHKIGVLYVGHNQCNNVIEILRNSHGSTRYVEFLRSIGTLVSLKEAVQNNLFITLDTGGADGKFTYIWKDDIVHVSLYLYIYFYIYVYKIFD